MGKVNESSLVTHGNDNHRSPIGDKGCDGSDGIETHIKHHLK